MRIVFDETEGVEDILDQAQALLAYQSELLLDYGDARQCPRTDKRDVQGAIVFNEILAGMLEAAIERDCKIRMPDSN